MSHHGIPGRFVAFISEAQDAELLRHTRMLIHLLEKNGISLEQLEAEVTSSGHLEDGVAQSQSATDASATSAPAKSEK